MNKTTNIKNIILITIDCLRADFVYQMKKNNVFAPNLKKILKESLFFPLAITNGPGTRFAFPSLLMSKLPGELEGLGLPEEEGVTIAEFFQEKGFVTIGIHSNGWLSSEFNYHRGFNYFFDPLNWSKKEYKIKKKTKEILKRKKILFKLAQKGKNLISFINSGFSFSYQFAENINQKLFEVISQNKLEKESKFIWLHYMDTHHPYLLHPEFVSFYPELKNINQKVALDLWRKTREDINKLSQKERAILISIYKSEISYIDFCIGELLKTFPDSVLVITSDHGEEFGEHGGFHQPTFYNEMINIPLIIYGISKTGKNPALVSHVDLAPFVASNLGFELEDLWSGTNDVEKNKYQFARYDDFNRQGLALMDKNYKFILQNNYSEFLERSTDKPVQNLLQKKHFEEELKHFKRLISQRKIKLSPVEISEKIEQQLKDLGYL